ncbi:DUF4236 domain-containing protein [Biomaibacter acetigenes]|uniref:DUF4236 domain-containing protein n=2 Tax=Biomaibacter acetigenes TaxID=2316383 RepID=A0A3G2R597_9FIRM|nr:DUF4236 domain-containing protein [Biomaibacter acetigenes]
MGWRLRKSIKIAKGVRLNVSKSGLGLSVGGKGFRVGVGPKGAYTSTSIPGTGLYSINYLGKTKSANSYESTVHENTKQYYENIQMPRELSKKFVKDDPIGGLGIIAAIVLLFISWPLAFIVGILSCIWINKKEKASPHGQAKEFFIKGKTAYRNGDYQKALECFSKVIELCPDTYSFYPEVAFLYRMAGKLQEAINLFEKYLEVYPEDHIVKLNYGITYGHLGDYEKLIEILQTLPVDVKQELPVINAMGYAYLALNKPELAIEILEKGPVRSRKIMDEQMKNFRYLLGTAYKENGDTAKAIKEFQKIYAEDANYNDVKDILQELSMKKRTYPKLIK